MRVDPTHLVEPPPAVDPRKVLDPPRSDLPLLRVLRGAFEYHNRGHRLEEVGSIASRHVVPIVAAKSGSISRQARVRECGGSRPTPVSLGPLLVVGFIQIYNPAQYIVFKR